MRSDEYYGRTKTMFVILIALGIYLVSTVLSGMTVANASALTSLDFTPNYDKAYKQVAVLNSSKAVEDENEPQTLTLSSIQYDPGTLYLDWSDIEAERTRIELEAVKAKEEARKLNESKKPVSSESVVMVEGSMPLPSISDTSFKGYMCTHTITSKSSYQYKFLWSGNYDFHTDEYGILMYNDYYVVAMGSYYTDYKVGSTFRITLDSGTVFDVITGDEKADIHTDSLNMYRPKGNGRGEIVEFVIACGKEGSKCNQYTTMNSYNRTLGDLSSLGFKGDVIKVEKLDDDFVINQLYGEEVS